MKTLQVEVNANELNDILRKHFNADYATIKTAYIASIKNQHQPKLMQVGIGGVCTITVAISTQ